MGRSPTDPAEKAAAALEELRETVREAHGALNDLERVVKEAKELRATLPKRTEELIEESIGIGLIKYHAALVTAIDNASDAVFKRFQELSDRLLGKDKSNRGKPTLEELVITDKTLDMLGLHKKDRGDDKR